MPGQEGYSAEKLLNNLIETIGDNVSKQKSAPFFEDDSKISTQMNKLFGRQKTIHKVFGGGKSADVLLWRNKKISASVLTGATITWVLFEWLNYHFLTLVGFVLVVGMVIQFVWTNASGLLNRPQSQVPRIVLPDELFENLAKTVGAEVNLFLGFLQDVSTGRNLKQFLLVIVSLWAAAVIGSWCNFLSVLYIDEWWRNFGIDDLELQTLAIRILSQTCSSSGCERNWSVFKRIHTKRRNRLEHKRLNDLVYTHYNLRLKERQASRKSLTDPISLENIDLTDDWVVEAEDDDAPLLDVDEIDDWMDVADAILDEGEGGAAAGFVAAHTLPVLYERYEDQVDDFVYKVFGEMQRHFQKLDTGVLSKIPKGNVKGKKKD